METVSYIVSDDSGQITPVGEDTPTEYLTPEDAGDAIREGRHGDYGTRYVLKVTIEQVAEYSRLWTLVRKADHEHIFRSPHSEEICYGSPYCTLTYAEHRKASGS